MIEITADRTRTVLFSTHIISDLERVADQIWILRDGALAWAGPLDALQGSVVRLSINARRSLPAVLPLTACLSQRVAGERGSAVVTQWTEQRHSQLQETLDADIAVEPLGLEDIFVELHS